MSALFHSFGNYAQVPREWHGACRYVGGWEVLATYFNYKRKYKTEEETLAKMRQAYQENIPTRNLHFIMGTMASHPQTFIMWDAALGCGP